MQYGGKCGVCGDPYGASPRNHEAPGGRYVSIYLKFSLLIPTVIPTLVPI